MRFQAFRRLRYSLPAAVFLTALSWSSTPEIKPSAIPAFEQSQASNAVVKADRVVVAAPVEVITKSAERLPETEGLTAQRAVVKAEPQATVVSQPEAAQQGIPVRRVPVQIYRFNADGTPYIVPAEKAQPAAKPKPKAALLEQPPSTQAIVTTGDFTTDMAVTVRGAALSTPLLREELQPKTPWILPNGVDTTRINGRRIDKVKFFFSESRDVIKALNWKKDTVVAHPHGRPITLGEIARHPQIFMLPTTVAATHQWVAALNKYGFTPQPIAFKSLPEYQGLPAAHVRTLENYMPNLNRQESGGLVAAVSWVGAMGPMQFMPQTAIDFGLKNPFDPLEARQASVRYIAGGLQKYNGNARMAFAAYSAGDGRVQLALAACRQKDFMRCMPRETRGHSAGILSRAHQAEDATPKNTFSLFNWFSTPAKTEGSATVYNDRPENPSVKKRPPLIRLHR